MKRYQGMRAKGRPYVLVVDDCGFTSGLRHVGRHAFLRALEWGYDGSAPRDLALSILCDLVGRDVADGLYLRFARDLIARLPNSSFDLSEATILEWVAEQNKKAA